MSDNQSEMSTDINLIEETIDITVTGAEDSWTIAVAENESIGRSSEKTEDIQLSDLSLYANFEEGEDLKITEDYYEAHAQSINKNFSQGYQIALIKNPKCKSKSLKIQNFSYLASLIDINSESFIAEVGCGNGQFLNYLSSIDDYKGFQYYGIDISETQLNNAENSTEYNRKSFNKVDMHNFFSYEPYFDAIYFIESIGYALNLETVVQSISSGVKVGGHVIIKNPVRIVVNEEKYLEVKEKFSLIESEYGYSKDSLGMLPDKNLIEKTFLDNGFELEKFEIPEYDTSTYNKTFCKVKSLAKQHTNYVEHITNMKEESYYPNQYLECGIFVFKKVEEIKTSQNQTVASNIGLNAVQSSKFEALLNEELNEELDDLVLKPKQSPISEGEEFVSYE
jgi:SAM-dependent methyltransferase